MRTLAALLLALVPLAALAQSPTPPAPAAAPIARPRPQLPIPLQPNLPTIFLVGDSTVRNGKGDGGGGQWGWGEPLVHFFDLARVNVTNRALGGRSSRTYITEGLWAETLALIKPGDVVLIQFGHNDGGPTPEIIRARGSLDGTGEQSEEVENPFTHQTETVHSFGWYLRKYVQDVRAKHATPILCTLVPRKLWKDGHIERNTGTYAGWTRQVAETEKVPLLDLNELIARRYDALGPEKVEELFADPHTHTSLKGAELNAEVVVSALKTLAPNPVTNSFAPQATRIAPAPAN